MGETAARFLPWPSGRVSKGDRLGIGPLWCAFGDFPRTGKVTPRGERLPADEAALDETGSHSLRKERPSKKQEVFLSDRGLPPAARFL